MTRTAGGVAPAADAPHLRDERVAHRPLRIGLVVEDFPTLSETFIVNQAAGLLARGQDVQILCLGHPSDTPGEASTIAPTQIRRPVWTTAPDAEWTLMRRGLAFLGQVPMLSSAGPFDIVHCQFATLGLQVLRHLRFGTLRTKRLVVHLRGYDISQYVEEHGADIYAPLFRRADLFIANCTHFRDRAAALGCPSTKLKVIGSAIDCTQFAPDPRPAAQAVRLISVGRLVEKKGFADAIRGVAEVMRQVPEIDYRIVGGGPLYDTLARDIHALGLQDRTHLLGPKRPAEVAQLLRTSDLMIAPSVRSVAGDEDAPVNTLKEAMATGLPVIATRHGGIPELVDDGVHGHLVPERDPSAIAAALRRLLADRARWPAIGDAARAKVLATYDLPVVTTALLDTYHQLLAPRRSP